MTALRIAIPKGRLQSRIFTAFAEAGLEVPDLSTQGRRLILRSGELEFVLVKDADVPLYVESGTAAMGVAGRDQLLEAQSDVYQPLAFEFGRCRLSLIAAAGAPALRDAKTIATKYPHIARTFLQKRHLQARVAALAGSVELAPLVGLAPYIIDLVESGATMREHGLLEIEVLEQIAPILIVNRNADRIEGKRIRSVIEAIEARISTEARA
jgi:ATP phosphoribosyltransferase